MESPTGARGDDGARGMDPGDDRREDAGEDTGGSPAGVLAPIIAEWERLSLEEPWHIDPHRHGTDSLHEAIRAVLDVANSGGADRSVHERLVRAAAAHGDQRRAQGVGDDTLLREYPALRAAIWRHLQHTSPSAPAAIAAVLRIDVAIGVATIVALRSYHRRDMPPDMEWEADILRQVEAVSRHLVDLLGA